MASISPYQPEPITELDRRAARLETLMQECATHLVHIMDALHTGLLRANFEQLITVNNQPQTLGRNGRRHTMIWVSQTVSCLIDNLGAGFAPVILYAGWNPLDLSEAARIMTATSSPSTFTMLWRCSDFELPGGLV